MGEPSKYKQWFYVWAAALLIIFFCSAWPASLYFVNDDFVHVPLSGHRVFGQTHLLRPVSEFTLLLDYRNWGKNALGYHITNLVIHLVNVFLVYLFSRLLFRRYGEDQGQWLSYKSSVTALLFLVYPFHGEAFYWILGRGAALGCLFTLLTLIFYLKRADRFFYLFLSLACFVLGLFAYETTIVLPILITILHYFEKKKKSVFPKRPGNIWWYWAVLAIALFIRYYNYRSHLDTYEANNLLAMNFRALIYNFNALIARTFLPPMSSGIAFASAYVTVFIACCVLGVYLFRKKGTRINFLQLPLLFYGITLLPVISLGIDTHDPESDRFLYLPSCFFLIAVIEVLDLLFKTSKRTVYCIIAISIYFAVYLVVFSDQYKRASAITRQSMAWLGSEKNAYRNIYVIDLPTQYKGATIFRSGFNEALTWICPGLGFAKVEILSEKEIMRPVKKLQPLDTAFLPWKQNSLAAYPEGSRIRNFLVSDTFETGKDLLLKWTDSTMIKIK